MELTRRSPRCFRRVNKTSGADVYLLLSKLLNTSEISYLWCLRTLVSVFIYLFVYYSDLCLSAHCWYRGLLLHLITVIETHTHTHTHTWYGSSGRGIGLSQRHQPGNTHHTQEANIHAQSGIRTRNPSKRATADPGLRPLFSEYGIFRL